MIFQIKKIALGFCLILVVQVNSFAQFFNESFGIEALNWFEIGSSVELINDSIYVFYTSATGSIGTQTCIANVSNMGELNWTSCIANDSTFYSFGNQNSSEFTLDQSKIVVGGTTAGFLNGESLDLGYLATLYAYNTELDNLFAIHVGDSTNLYSGNQARNTNDGGSILAGRFRDTENESSDSDILLVKFNSIGEQEWLSTHNVLENHYDEGKSLLELDNGNFLVGSWLSESLLNGPSYSSLTIFNSSGAFLDSYVFSNNGFKDQGARISKAQNGDILVSSVLQIDEDVDSYRLTRFTPDLDVVWDKTYELGTSSCMFSQVKELEDGTIIGCGFQIDENGYQFGSIMKFESDGDLQWYRLYQNADTGWLQNNKLNDVIFNPATDGYIVVGEKHGIDGSQDVWILSLDSLGCIASDCGIESVNSLGDENFQIDIGPIPTDGNINVFIPEVLYITASLKYQVLDLQGKIVLEGSFNNSSPISIIQLDDGFYVLRVLDRNNELVRKKILKE